MSGPRAIGRRHALVGGLWASASNVVPLFGTTVLSVVMARILGPIDLGVQSLIAYVESLLGALLVFAMTGAVIRMLAVAIGAGNDTEIAHLQRWSMIANTAMGAVGAVILGGVALLSDTPLPWAIVSLTALLNGLGWAYSARSIAADGWQRVAQRRLVWQSIAQGLGIGAVVAGFGISGVFAANAIAAVGLLWTVRRLPQKLAPGPWRPLPRPLFVLWGKFIVFEGLNQVVSKRVEFLFLAAMSTPDQIAMYSIPFMIVSMAVLTVTSVIGSGMPAIAAAVGAGDDHKVTAQVGHAIRVAAVLGMMLTAGLVALGGPLVLLVYGADFRQAAELVPLMSVVALLAPMSSLGWMLWEARNRLGPLLAATVTGGALDVAVAVTLIPRYGAQGAAVANVVGQGTVAILVIAYTWTRTDRFPLMGRRWLWALVVNALAGLTAYAVANALTGWVALLAGFVAGLAVFVGLAWRAPLLENADADWLRSTVPHRLHAVVRVVGGPVAASGPQD